MTEFYQHKQQQTKLSESSSLLKRTEMPSFYSSTRDQTHITKHLADHEDDSDSIYKEAFIIQIFQHWKIKTLEHQHGINNSGTNNTSNHFSQALAKKVPSVQSSNIDNDSYETSTNNIESKKPIKTMQKRVSPLPASYIRRKEALKKSISSPTDLLNPNLLAPYTRYRSRTISTTKSDKLAPIFIAPKKAQPSRSPRSNSLFSFDESTQSKRKTTLEKQNSTNDDPNSAPISPISPLWTPTRFFVPSPGSSVDDDSSSSDDGTYESLLIRNKKVLKKETKTKEIYPLIIPSNLIIPTAIFITDPNGNSRSYDLNNDFMEEPVDNERIIDNDMIPPIRNNEISRPASPSSIDKYALHSIGEEDEGSIEKNNKHGIILSQELNRIQAFTRSRQTNSNEQNNNTNLNEDDKILLGRRWSDGIVSDDEDHIRLPKSPLVKMASTTSVVKQSTTPPVKISRTKSLLMKLHLTSSSSSKDDDSNIPTNPPPTSSRKHTRTTLRSRQTSVNSDEPKQSQSNIKRQESTNTTASQPLKRHVSIADSVATEQTDYTRQDSRTESIENRSSVGDSGDDIDHKFEKAKTGSLKRASSLRDMRGSHLSLTSLMSEAKARYELEITGTIQFKLSYNPKTGSFDIFIKQCNNLARAKRNQTSNPYCKVYLLPDKSKGSKRKTGVRKGTTDPVFGETLRYHLSLQEFTSRTLWISVWSESSLGQNDFLGEVHVQLDNCRIDELEEYTLLPRAQEEDVVTVAEPTTGPSELYFELIFIENTKNKQKGTIQVNAIQGKGISQGKTPVEAICKGLLMPDKIKKKLPIIRQGPSPKWDIPLRWEDIQLSDLKNTSLEISIWNQERFRKTMIGSVKLNSTRTHLESRAVKSLVASSAEKEVWEAFQKDPTRKHKVRLPLRPPPIQRK